MPGIKPITNKMRVMVISFIIFLALTRTPRAAEAATENPFPKLCPLCLFSIFSDTKLKSGLNTANKIYLKIIQLSTMTAMPTNTENTIEFCAHDQGIHSLICSPAIVENFQMPHAKSPNKTKAIEPV